MKRIKPVYKALILFCILMLFVIGIKFLSKEIIGPDVYDVGIGWEAVSPDKKNIATFYTISGGGAAGYVLTRLNIRPNHQKFKPTKESNDFFLN